MSASGIMGLVHRLFPHRQFYLRSRGSVQFFEFSPAFQIFVVGGTVLTLLWLAYASIVVIFKEQIIAAQNQRYTSMNSAYESKIQQMLLAYDELNSLLVLAEERFQNATRTLEQRHRQLTQLLLQKQAMDKQLHTVRRNLAHMEGYTGRSYALAASRNGANTLTMQLAAAEPTLRLGRTTEAAAIGVGAVVASMTDAVAGEGTEGTVAAKHAIVRRLAVLEGQLADIGKGQVAVLSEILDNASSQIEKYHQVLTMTGLPANDVAEQVGRKGMGGPLLSGPELRGAANNAASEEFDRQFVDIAHSYGKLEGLTTALSRLPLVTPIATGQYSSTSGFGYRVDPFTGRPAFHSGADMAGGYGTAVLATAPGRVVAAERRGHYGNMVEIDHGQNIRTRYGHLQTILVKRGDWVHFRQKVATMGSTGRSTGPHLHYEIWYGSKAYNPTRFFDAGRYVYKG